MPPGTGILLGVTRTSLITWGLVALLAGTQGACKRQAVVTPTPPPPWAAYTPRHDGSNAYDTYLLAGQDALVRAPNSAKVTTWTNTTKDALERALSPTLDQLRTGHGQAFRSEARPRPLGVDDPVYNGWRLLTIALSTRIERLLAEDNLADAVTWTMIATRFGARLSQTGLEGATLGVGLMDTVRRQIAPELAQLSAIDLQRIEKELSETHRQAPNLDDAFAAEANQQQQFINDLSQRKGGQGPLLTEQLGSRGAQAVETFLKAGESERATWITNMTAEAARIRDEANAQRSPDASAPPRTEWWQKDRERPWSPLTQHLLLGPRVLPAVEKRYQSKLRLFALAAALQRQVVNAKTAPAQLPALDPELLTDPYSGRPFIYRAVGREYQVYSVGANKKDDGGETDRNGEVPDVALETRAFGF